jgi:hypothetical protein
MSDLSTLDLHRILDLPVELQCNIISHQHDPYLLAQLASVNSNLRRIVQDCVTQIELPYEDTLPVSLILRFPRLRQVDGYIQIKTVGELITVANMNSLTQAMFQIDAIGPNPDNIVAFIQQYCHGYVVTPSGFVSRHDRTLVPTRFVFQDDTTGILINLANGILLVWSTQPLDQYIGIIEALHQYNSMIGLHINSSVVPLPPEIIDLLLEMPEFNTLEIQTLNGIMPDPAAISRFLHANKIEIVEEFNNVVPPPVSENTRLLLELTSENPLRIANLPIDDKSLAQIANTLSHLELISVYLTYDDPKFPLPRLATNIKQVLTEHPNLQIQIRSSPFLYKGIIPEFLQIYTGPRDRLILPEPENDTESSEDTAEDTETEEPEHEEGELGRYHHDI